MNSIIIASIFLLGVQKLDLKHLHHRTQCQGQAYYCINDDTGDCYWTTIPPLSMPGTASRIDNCACDCKIVEPL